VLSEIELPGCLFLVDSENSKMYENLENVDVVLLCGIMYV